jgi:hypothetical protein
MTTGGLLAAKGAAEGATEAATGADFGAAEPLGDRDSR